MNKKILLWFDVEDYITPASEDALYALLQALDESGVKATLKFCAKKYRQLHENGRKDILRLVKNHELAFHMTDHSVHPLPTEYLDNLGFADGAAAFQRREEGGVSLLRELSGQGLSSFGQPGPAWAPQVFPALRKWGIPTYLDAHDLLDMGGQPFWYGGILCYTKLNNLSHLVKDGKTGSMIRQFKNMDTDCTDTVFLSVYDHPHELCCAEFWDEVNFADGQNPPFYRPAALRTAAERDGLIQQYRDYIAYVSAQPDVEFVTALESMRYERQRTAPITAEMVKNAAAAGAEANYAALGGAYCAPSELLNLMARLLTGRMLTPELSYGPERREKSACTGPVPARELAEQVLRHSELALGYKQLPPLYRVGDQFINPEDAFATLAAAISQNRSQLELVPGRLAAADHVDRGADFPGSWPLWRPGFKAENIVRHTALQCWTLKPAVF